MSNRHLEVGPTKPRFEMYQRVSFNAATGWRVLKILHNGPHQTQYILDRIADGFWIISQEVYITTA